MKAYIFDLDGVLVFTDRYHFLAWKKMADRIKVPFDEAINNRLRGISRMQSLEIILEKSEKSYSEKDKQKLSDEKNMYYQQYLHTMTPNDVSRQVRETLQSLRNRGHKLAIGSSSKNTKFILMQTDLDRYFDAVSDGTNITKSKPDPEVFLKAAEFLGERPEDCVVIEDAIAGIDAAKRAGMYACGIGEASHYAKTDYPLTTICDLLKLSFS